MTINLTRPEVILTHESDLDGFVSGLLLRKLARRLFDVNAPLQAYHNHNWRQRAMNERTAWVCDLAFEPRLDKATWIVVDHHTTDNVPKQATLVHDTTKSAGLLCYELCKDNGIQSERLDRLVHLNNVADLFLEDDPDFVVAGDYANLVKSYQFWNLHDLIDGDLERLVNHPLLEVMEIKRRVENPLGFEWSRANVIEISPSVGFVNTIIGNTNLIVHRLLEEKATPYPALLTLFRRGNGMILVSLRSRNGSAIKIAEKLQGGGHANASGAVLPRSVQQISDAIVYLRQILNPTPGRGTPLNNLESIFDSIEVTQK